MSLQLRPYQEQIIDDARVALRSHNSILIQSPVGSGKTALSVRMIGNAVKNNFPSFFIVHRVELLDQTAEAFEEAGIPYGIIASGYSPNPLQPAQICSIDTLKNRLNKLPFIPRFLTWDEAHHCAAAGWVMTKNAFPNAKHVGLSASPQRKDGKGLNEHFSYMVKGPTVKWLMANNYLCQYRAFGPDTPDLSTVPQRMNDYAQEAVAEIMGRPQIVGNVIAHYKQLALGRRALGFFVNVKESQIAAEKFRAEGIPAYHLDGTTDKSERKQAIQAFKSGQLHVLTNCDLFGEGFNVPAAEVLIDVNPTKSLSKVVQRWGRVQRKDGDKVALILDHCGNIMGNGNHGFPDDEREWTLEGREKKKRGAEEADVHMRACPKCYALHTPAPRCPECGWVYQVAGRSVEQVEGQLSEIDIEKARREMMFKKKNEVYRAETLEDLIKLGEERKYTYPREWAMRIFQSRKNKKKGPL